MNAQYTVLSGKTKNVQDPKVLCNLHNTNGFSRFISHNINICTVGPSMLGNETRITQLFYSAHFSIIRNWTLKETGLFVSSGGILSRREESEPERYPMQHFFLSYINDILDIFDN